jgi:hypothetical protein
MTSRFFGLFSLLLLALALTGCDQGRKAPAKTSVRVLNAAPSFTSLDYLRGQRQTQTNSSINLTYLSATEALSYDEDTYNFNVAATSDPSTNSKVPVLTFSQQVLAGTDYTFVLAENAGAVVSKVLETPTLAATAADSQIVLLHAAEALPAVDIYLEAPGADLLAATPWGRVAFLETLPAKHMPAGTYDLWVTEAGNPANVVLHTASFTLQAAKTLPFVISSASGSSSVDFGVAALADSPSVLLDVNAPAMLRVINGANDAAPRDVAIDGTVVVSAAPLAAVTPYVPVPIGAGVTMTVQPAGNPGVIELTTPITTEMGHLYTTFFTGSPGALTQTFSTDDVRPVRKPGNGLAKLALYNGATQFTAIDAYITLPGTDITTVFPSVPSFPAPGASGPIEIPPGDYQLTLRQTATTNTVAGPLSVHLDGGGVYYAIFGNGPDTATATITLRGDFP